MHACHDEETDDDEDEETDDEAIMTVDAISQPCGEEDFNEDLKSAIANVRKEVKKFKKG